MACLNQNSVQSQHSIPAHLRDVNSDPPQGHGDIRSARRSSRRVRVFASWIGSCQVTFFVAFSELRCAVCNIGMELWALLCCGAARADNEETIKLEFCHLVLGMGQGSVLTAVFIRSYSKSGSARPSGLQDSVRDIRPPQARRLRFQAEQCVEEHQRYCLHLRTC